jgi:hypothetical protein
MLGERGGSRNAPAECPADNDFRERQNHDRTKSDGRRAVFDLSDDAVQREAPLACRKAFRSRSARS